MYDLLNSLIGSDVTSMALVEIVRDITYEVRQGLVTCHDPIFTNKCKLSKDKLITSY